MNFKRIFVHLVLLRVCAGCALLVLLAVGGTAHARATAAGVAAHAGAGAGILTPPRHPNRSNPS